MFDTKQPFLASIIYLIEEGSFIHVLLGFLIIITLVVFGALGAIVGGTIGMIASVLFGYDLSSSVATGLGLGVVPLLILIARVELISRINLRYAGGTYPKSLVLRVLRYVGLLLPNRIDGEDLGDAVEDFEEMLGAGASRSAIWRKVAKTAVHVGWATLIYVFAPRLPTGQVDRSALHDLLLHVFDGDELRLFVWRMKGGPELIKELPDRGGLSPRVWFGLVIEAMERRKYIDAEFFELLKKERPRWAEEIETVRKGRPKK